MNNFQKIKSMKIDEMSKFIVDFDCYKSCEHEGRCGKYENCINGIKKYLEQEADD